MFRALFAFAFILSATAGFSQTNSEKASQVPGPSPTLPVSTKLVKDSTAAADSAKARKASRKSKAKAKSMAADSAKTAQAVSTHPVKDTAKAAAAAPADTSKTLSAKPDGTVSAPIAAKPDSTALKPGSTATAPVKAAETAATQDSAKPAQGPVSPATVASSATGGDTIGLPAADTGLGKAPDIKRIPPDIRLLNDPTLIAKEYGFGILGSVVAGALGFYIGSGLETAFEGESKAHKGTLSFTGIRYDNYKGAFWGGATGMVLGSALTTYFIGQTDEEDGGLFLTLAGTAAAGAGAFYIAHLAGVNDDIDWKPFIPLLAIPSLGGTFGFNVSRWFSDHKREETVGRQAGVWLHAPGLAWGRSEGGDRLEVRALNLTF